MVREYELARATLTNFVETPNDVILPFFVATGEWESCITTMVRAINLGRRIRNDRNGPEVARRIRVLSDVVGSRVNDMRNAIEHIDTQIANNTWTQGQPICLIVKQDRIAVNSQDIQFNEFAAWITELQELAGQLAEYHESDSAQLNAE